MCRYNFPPDAPVALTPCPDYDPATVRAALDNLLSSLGLNDPQSQDAAEETDEEPAPKSARSRRKSEPDQSTARKDILKMLSEHKITADEAAKRLKEL